MACSQDGEMSFVSLQVACDPHPPRLHGDGDCNSPKHSHRSDELHLQRGKENCQTAVRY